MRLDYSSFCNAVCCARKQPGVVWPLLMLSGFCIDAQIFGERDRRLNSAIAPLTIGLTIELAHAPLNLGLHRIHIRR